MTVVCLSQSLLAATAAQISRDSSKNLHPKQCEDTQQGEEVLNFGTPLHVLYDLTVGEIVQGKDDMKLSTCAASLLRAEAPAEQRY